MFGRVAHAEAKDREVETFHEQQYAALHHKKKRKKKALVAEAQTRDLHHLVGGGRKRAKKKVLHREIVAHETELAERRNREHTEKLDMARLKKEGLESEYREYATQHGYDPDGTDWHEEEPVVGEAEAEEDEDGRDAKKKKKKKKKDKKKDKDGGSKGEAITYFNPVHDLEETK